MCFTELGNHIVCTLFTALFVVYPYLCSSKLSDTLSTHCVRHLVFATNQNFNWYQSRHLDLLGGFLDFFSDCLIWIVPEREVLSIALQYSTEPTMDIGRHA